MADIIDVLSESGFLLVKVSDKEGISPDVRGKLFAIPEGALAQFLVNPTNTAEIDEQLNRLKRVNVDYAAYLINLIMRGSAGG